MKMSAEAKVGAFTLLGIILFIASILFVGHFSLFQDSQMTITGKFDNVTGLKEGGGVSYSGVRVGKIERITVATDGVTVVLKVDKKTQIPVDSKFAIQSDGMLGDKFIQITPGQSTNYLKDGDTFDGTAGGMDKTLDNVNKLMDGANKTINSINNIIGDEKTQGALRDTLRTTSIIADNTAALTGQMNAILAQNSGNVNALTSNMVSITRNVDELTAQMNQTAKTFDNDGQAGAEMRQILDNLKTTTDSVDKMAKSMEGIVTDPKSQEDIRETLHNTAQISRRINKLTGGTTYVSDKEASQVDGTSKNDRSKVDDSEKKSKISTETFGELLYNNQKDEYTANGNVRLFMNKSMFELGASNLGDGTDLNLNYGKFLTNKFLVRGGFFDGDLGLSLDYGLGGPFSISAAMMDLNDQRYRIRSEIKLFKDTYGVAQFTRPYSDARGGNYFGIKQVF